ncbi:MAG: hypothetical protein VX476_05755, partial [Actinomycetota bacterium]|nr:hypothetical protein [Actinomycetota bacterium]
MRFRLGIAISTALLITFAAAACGSDSETTSEQATATTSAPATTKAPAATSDSSSSSSDTSSASDLPEVCDGQDGTGLKVAYGDL